MYGTAYAYANGFTLYTKVNFRKYFNKQEINILKK